MLVVAFSELYIDHLLVQLPVVVRRSINWYHRQSGFVRNLISWQHKRQLKHLTKRIAVVLITPPCDVEAQRVGSRISLMSSLLHKLVKLQCWDHITLEYSSNPSIEATMTWKITVGLYVVVVPKMATNMLCVQQHTILLEANK